LRVCNRPTGHYSRTGFYPDRRTRKFIALISRIAAAAVRYFGADGDFHGTFPIFLSSDGSSDLRYLHSAIAVVKCSCTSCVAIVAEGQSEFLRQIRFADDMPGASSPMNLSRVGV
jgi:hypothetical protein